MVNTIDRASVEEDSTSSSLAVRESTFPPPVVGMMIRELVPPTIVPAISHARNGAGLTNPIALTSQSHNQTEATEKTNPARPRSSPRGPAAVTSSSRNREAPAERMMVSATAPNSGTAGWRRVGETNSNTGPARTPAHTSQRTSGMPVRQKTNSPTAPSSRMPATISSTWATESIMASCSDLDFPYNGFSSQAATPAFMAAKLAPLSMDPPTYSRARV